LYLRRDNIAAYAEDHDCLRAYYGLKWNPLEVNNTRVRAWEMRHFGAPADRPHAWRQSSINLNPSQNIHVHGIVNYDYSLIVKTPNPLNPAATVLVVCGIHGMGTLGGTLYLYERVFRKICGFKTNP